MVVQASPSNGRPNPPQNALSTSPATEMFGFEHRPKRAKDVPVPCKKGRNRCFTGTLACWIQTLSRHTTVVSRNHNLKLPSGFPWGKTSIGTLFLGIGALTQKNMEKRKQPATEQLWLPKTQPAWAVQRRLGSYLVPAFCLGTDFSIASHGDNGRFQRGKLQGELIVVGSISDLEPNPFETAELAIIIIPQQTGLREMTISVIQRKGLPEDYPPN